MNRMKAAGFVFVALLVLALAFSAARGERAESLPAVAGNMATFLICFGADGARDVDWSGSISPAPSRLAGWQFDEGDEIRGNTWKCTTRMQNYWDTPYERSMKGTSNREKLTQKGIVIEFANPAGSRVQVETRQGSFAFATDQSFWDIPGSFLDGRVTLRSVPPAARLSSGAEAEDYPSLLQAKDGALWVAYQEWSSAGDHVFVRRRSGGLWSQPETLTTAPGDCFRTAIAQDGAGRIWVVWSEQVSANFDLYARFLDGERWSPKQQLTTAPGSDIYHSLTSDPAGNLYLAYQSSRSGNFDIFLRIYDGKTWSKEIRVSSDPANDWQPALAAAPDGRVTVLWDTYARGNYDIVLRTYRQGRLGPLVSVADSGAFESRASAQYDNKGRLWMAWDEGDWNWGKDYGNLVSEKGRGLLVRRQARVAVLSNGTLQQPGADISTAIPEDFRQVFQQPRLVLDNKGAPWLFFRYRVNLPREVKGDTYRALWRMAATSYRKDRWLPVIEFPGLYGRMDAPAAAVVGPGGELEIASVTDGRQWPAGFPQQQDLFVATLPALSSPSDPDLIALSRPSESLPSPHPNEAADVARVRAYRVTLAGRRYRIARGDIHRHTDISWDGNRDGSLDDSYRYALDAAGFDYLGVCDHQGGESIPYHWWMIQKAVDLFTIPGRFAPLYSYERSLSWPNGHRNVLFTRRGSPILEPSEDERRGKEGAQRLYEYLRRLGGLTTSHTSATGAGTDWRDSDPALEPVVEIYQGYRNNFEEPNAPRAVSAEQARRYAAGFVWNAWANGIKLGVQSSSDHVSTHISYAAVFVDRLDRDALFRALKARRSFAATDNIVLDFRMGDHFMGERVEARAAKPFRAYIQGTGPIAEVSLIKNNKVIYSRQGTRSEMAFTFTDTENRPGESYYYIRVEQRDGQLGWSSPIWVRP